MQFIIDNIATIIAALILASVVALVVIKMLRDRKKGKNRCGCDCGGCEKSSVCR